MIYTRARFDKLSPAAQGLVFIALPFPFFIPFAIFGDLPRGTLFWAFSTALLNALFAFGEGRKSRISALSIPFLVAVHILLVIRDPLRHVHLLGGLFVPIAFIDYCIDYAFLWLITRTFNKFDL